MRSLRKAALATLAIGMIALALVGCRGREPQHLLGLPVIGDSPPVIVPNWGYGYGETYYNTGNPRIDPWGFADEDEAHSYAYFEHYGCLAHASTDYRTEVEISVEEWNLGKLDSVNAEIVYAARAQAKADCADRWK